MKSSVLVTLICFCIYWDLSIGANILVVLPNIEYDEFKETSKLAQQLSLSQHNVTVLSPFLLEENDGINQIFLSGDVQKVKEEKNKIYGNDYIRDSYWSKLKYHNAMGLTYLEFVVGSDSFKELVASNNTTFDLVILEDVGAYGLAVLSEIFKCPLITLLSEPLSLFYEDFVFDNNMLYSNYLHIAHYWFFKKIYIEWIIFPSQKALLKDVNHNELNFVDALYKTRLVLMPSYQSVSNLMPKYSQVKQIGGYNRLSWDQKFKELSTEYRNSTENVVVISKRLPEEVKIQLEKMKLSIPVRIENTWNISQIIGNPDVKLFIGDGNVYETDIVASMRIPIVFIKENRRDQQFLTDFLTEEINVLSASVKDKKLMECGIYLSLLLPTVFSKNIQLSSLMMQSEREAQNGLDKAMYWIEQVLKYSETFYFGNFRVMLDLQNRWLIIAIVLIVIDIVLFLLFYWIFRHLGETLLFCVGLFYLLINRLRTLLGRKRARRNRYVQIEKLGLCNNDKVEKSVEA